MRSNNDEVIMLNREITDRESDLYYLESAIARKALERDQLRAELARETDELRRQGLQYKIDEAEEVVRSMRDEQSTKKDELERKVYDRDVTRSELNGLELERSGAQQRRQGHIGKWRTAAEKLREECAEDPGYPIPYE